MRELPGLLVVFALGGLMGLFYFGGLWWTVQRLPAARQPLVTYFASVVVRIVAACALFALVLWLSGGKGLVACLGGFMLARLAMTRRLSRDASPTESSRMIG